MFTSEPISTSLGFILSFDTCFLGAVLTGLAKIYFPLQKQYSLYKSYFIFRNKVRNFINILIIFRLYKKYYAIRLQSIDKLTGSCREQVQLFHFLTPWHLGCSSEWTWLSSSSKPCDSPVFPQLRNWLHQGSNAKQHIRLEHLVSVAGQSDIFNLLIRIILEQP